MAAILRLYEGVPDFLNVWEDGGNGLIYRHARRSNPLHWTIEPTSSGVDYYVDFCNNIASLTAIPVTTTTWADTIAAYPEYFI